MRGPECESCGATAPTLSVWNSANPTTQPHPEPIAWMVGTAFWWTKEEAETDAAATGLPIVGLGPMTRAAPAEQPQGEPVPLPANMHPHDFDNLPEAHCNGWNACLDEIAKLGPLYSRPVQGYPVAYQVRTPKGAWASCNKWLHEIGMQETRALYPYADPGEVERHIERRMEMAGEKTELYREVERLRNELGEAKGEYDRSANKVSGLEDQLAEAQALLGECRENIRQGLYEDDPAWNDLAKKIDALSASAEPSAPGLGILHDLSHRGPSAKATESLAHYGPPAASTPAGAKMGETLEITGWKYENYKPRDPKYHIHLDKGLPESAPKYTSYRVFLVGGPDSAGIGYRSGLIYNQGDTLVIDGKTYTFGRLELKS
ncbi:hypothetical protein A3K88_02925 [Pseudomonas putida]|nr:hypothetical protein A3K88_02925 [Pseudomonas putida]